MNRGYGMNCGSYGVYFLLFAWLAVGGCAAPAEVDSNHAAAPMLQSNAPTIAEEVLAMEMGTADSTRYRNTLRRIIDLAAAKFGTAPAGEPERAKAERFFKCVDDTLIEQNFIFPPEGLVALLRNALQPRTLSDDEYLAATRRSENARRLEEMKRNFNNQGQFHIADCDLTSIIYKAVGERLGLPIAFVATSEHNFVRWSSPTLKLNWDTNDGKTYSDEQYAKDLGVTEVGRKRLGWLEDMPRADILSYWWRLIGNWRERHGQYQEALEALRAGVKASPDNLDAANELAWFLATTVNPTLRNGPESVAIAKRVVAVAPRANWIDTLAAAQAEAGDFNAAVKTEIQAKKAAETLEWGLSSGEEVAGFDKCIAAYRKHLSYRQAVERGLLEDPKENLHYDD